MENEQVTKPNEGDLKREQTRKAMENIAFYTRNRVAELEEAKGYSPDILHCLQQLPQCHDRDYAVANIHVIHTKDAFTRALENLCEKHQALLVVGEPALGEAIAAPVKFDSAEIEAAAKASHMANREYCQRIGDLSQLPWEEAPEWQRQSAINGVKQIIDNPATTPEQSHESWLEEKRKDGWKYGPVKDPEKKEHPCFVSYDKLPEEQREKDTIFGKTVRESLGMVSGQMDIPGNPASEGQSGDEGAVPEVDDDLDDNPDKVE